jgi:hypothetical protein
MAAKRAPAAEASLGVEMAAATTAALFSYLESKPATDCTFPLLPQE